MILSRIPRVLFYPPPTGIRAGHQRNGRVSATTCCHTHTRLFFQLRDSECLFRIEEDTIAAISSKHRRPFFRISKKNNLSNKIGVQFFFNFISNATIGSPRMLLKFWDECSSQTCEIIIFLWIQLHREK